jgi:hypothetical protein
VLPEQLTKKRFYSDGARHEDWSQHQSRATLYIKALPIKVKVEVARTVPIRSILSAVGQGIVSKTPMSVDVSKVCAEDP